MLGILKKYYHGTSLFSLLILYIIMLAFLVMEINNHRLWMNDFKVYYTASGRFIKGETLYQPLIDGHFHYKYSPPAAFFFTPFLLFPFSVASVLYWLINSALVCLGFYLILKLLQSRHTDIPISRLNFVILLTALIMSVHLERELHLGQVNHLLLVTYIAIMFLFVQNRMVAPAILWAGSLFIKPFGLIFLPYFIVKRKYGMLIYGLLFLIVFLMIPFLFYSPVAMWKEYHYWLSEMGLELAQKEGFLAAGNHTIFSILVRYTPLRYLHFNDQLKLIYQLFILVLISGIFLYLLKKGRRMNKPQILEFSFLISLIPMLSFTSYNAFGFFELTVFLVVFHFSDFSKRIKIAAIIGVIFVGGNIHDIMGHKLWTLFNDWSLVGIGALLLMVGLVFLRKEQII